MEWLILYFFFLVPIAKAIMKKMGWIEEEDEEDDKEDDDSEDNGNGDSKGSESGEEKAHKIILNGEPIYFDKMGKRIE